MVQTMGSKYTGEPTTAADQFRGDASRTTDAAVAEGQKDLDEAKAAGAGYVEQAKSLTNNAIETAQVRVLKTHLGLQTPLVDILEPGLPANSNGWEDRQCACCVDAVKNRHSENRNWCRRIGSNHNNECIYSSERGCSIPYRKDPGCDPRMSRCNWDRRYAGDEHCRKADARLVDWYSCRKRASGE